MLEGKQRCNVFEDKDEWGQKSFSGTKSSIAWTKLPLLKKIDTTFYFVEKSN